MQPRQTVLVRTRQAPPLPQRLCDQRICLPPRPVKAARIGAKRLAAGIGGVWSRRDGRLSSWRYAANCSPDLHKHSSEAARNRSGRADLKCGVPPSQMWSPNLEAHRGGQRRRSAAPSANSQTSHLVGDTGVEPVTSCVSCKRANQLRQSPGRVSNASTAGAVHSRGGDRIRTGVHGFAGRCLTTRPLRPSPGEGTVRRAHRCPPYTRPPRQFAAWPHCPALSHESSRRAHFAGHAL